MLKPFQLIQLSALLFLAGCGGATIELPVTPTATTTPIAPLAPTLVSLTPATASLLTLPTSVVATFSAAMSDIGNSAFVISGTCTTAPTVSSVTMSTDKKTATATLTGGTCSGGQILIVTLNPLVVTDLVGTAGAGDAKTVSFTRIPRALLEQQSLIPNNGLPDSLPAGSGSYTLTLVNNGELAAVIALLSSSIITGSASVTLTYGSSTCSGATVPPSATCTIIGTYNDNGGLMGTKSVTVPYHDGVSSTTLPLVILLFGG